MDRTFDLNGLYQHAGEGDTAKLLQVSPKLHPSLHCNLQVIFGAERVSLSAYPVLYPAN